MVALWPGPPKPRLPPAPGANAKSLSLLACKSKSDRLSSRRYFAESTSGRLSFCPRTKVPVAENSSKRSGVNIMVHL